MSPSDSQRSYLDAESTVLFLGAGISVAEPSSSPLFSSIRDATIEQADVELRKQNHRRYEAERALLNHIIPEVFLREMTVAGLDPVEQLARMSQGNPNGQPNIVHDCVAQWLKDGTVVWTTNWDTWIERAYERLSGEELARSIYPRDPCPQNRPLFGKLHGTADDTSTLLFTSDHTLQPISREWRDAIVDSCTDKYLLIAGYAGADVDIFPALLKAVERARAVCWFEGTTSSAPWCDRAAAYGRWRFGLELHRTPTELPISGQHQVWCGRDQVNETLVSNPSDGLLLALGCQQGPNNRPPLVNQHSAVNKHFSGRSGSATRLASRIQLSAIVNERLGRRRQAAMRHLLVVVLGRGDIRFKSLRGLSYICSRVDRPRFLKPIVDMIQKIAQAQERTHNDPDHNISKMDKQLDACREKRWRGNLDCAANQAKSAFDTAVDKVGQVASLARESDNGTTNRDTDIRRRDWPERIARACFEYAHALLWQGKFFEVEEVCRGAYMRIAGAKWTAWEYMFRGVVCGARGHYHQAIQHLDDAAQLLHSEGFNQALPFIWISQAATRRASSLESSTGSNADCSHAQQLLRKAQKHARDDEDIQSILLAEEAEYYYWQCDPAIAIEKWRKLSDSSIVLMRAVAQMRLGEIGCDPQKSRELALSDFEEIGCCWGLIRTKAAIHDWPREKVQREAQALGPSRVFQPNAAWIL